MSDLLDPRSREIFRRIVEEYLRTGVPVGSRTVSTLDLPLSPATIRHVMADLEDAELLFSPHISAGRQPTQRGLRLYVDTLMKIDDITPQRAEIERHLHAGNRPLTKVYEEASTLLSGLSSCVGLVIAPKMNKPIRQVQFLKLEPRKLLAILITQDGMVENRIVQVAEDVDHILLEQATTYLNNRLAGLTVQDIGDAVQKDIARHQDDLSQLMAVLIQDGIILPISSLDNGHIFIQGQSKLFDDPQAQGRLDEIRYLFSLLEEKRAVLDIMNAVQDGDGVQIFIGSENRIFSRPAWSTVIRAYKDQNGRIIGATGIIGPTRLDYGRIVPIVDYTSLVMENLLKSPPFDAP